MTTIEFYKDGAEHPLATVRDAGGVPREGDLINILTQTWQVRRVTWAVDHSNYPREATLRANVDLALVS